MAEQAVYATPESDLTVTAAPKEYPGLRRLPYFGWYLAMFTAVMVTVFAFREPTAVGIAYLLFMCGFFYLMVQRLRNTAASGWWALGIFVPLLNIYVGLRAWAFPEGYGDHKQFDTAAKVIIGFFVASFALGVLAAVLMPAMVS